MKPLRGGVAPTPPVPNSCENRCIAIAALSISVGKPGKWVLVSADLHKPLEQMLAVPKSASHPEVAKQFAAFINGEKGRPLMQKYGFVLPGEEPVS